MNSILEESQDVTSRVGRVENRETVEYQVGVVIVSTYRCGTEDERCDVVEVFVIVGFKPFGFVQTHLNLI